MSKITSLTEKQKQELVEWRKRYFDIGWSTKPSDRARAEKGMLALYKRKGLAAPKFLWVDSPRAAALIIKESTGKVVPFSGCDGSFDAYWAAFYTFCLHIGGTASEDDKAHMAEWCDVIESTGPCYPYTKICIMTERPVIASYDEREVLHSDDGPAIAYKDGYKLYAVHGVTVPEQVIETPWTMTLKQIEKESNEDIKTIMQDRWCYEEKDSTGRRLHSGGGRWLKETGAKTLDMDVYTAYTDEKTGEETQIQRALIVDKQGRKFLMCSDSSTDRIYYIQVSQDAKNCREGHESINGGIPDAKIRVSA